MIIRTSALLVALSVVPPVVLAQSGQPLFQIDRYEIDGNSLIDDERLMSLIQSHTGPSQSIDSIRRAQAAIEQQYRDAGYDTVRAITPEQALDTGVIRIVVIESRIKQVKVVGNQHFDNNNVLNSLPALKEDTPPSLRQLSENIQLANENPAKQIEVLLNSLPVPGEIEARVLVKDSQPVKVSATLDNTGNASTGRHRAGVAVQHANLFNADHVATAAYITSPEEPSRVDIFSVSYRLPLYQLGDSIDVIVGDSSVESATTETVAGPLNFNGSGRVYGLRYNHYFAREGEFSARITVGLDQKEFDNNCNIGGLSCGSADQDVSTRAATIAWLGLWQSAGRRTELFYTYAANLGGVSNGDDASFQAIRNGANNNFKVLRYGFSQTNSYKNNWQSRLALIGQYSKNPLIPGEQFGLVGSTLVRGFEERAIGTDQGTVVNIELYSPNFGSALGLPESVSTRAIGFIDYGFGKNNPPLSSTDLRETEVISAGLGLRFELTGRMTLNTDLASVINTEDRLDEERGDLRLHFLFTYLF